MLKINNQYRAVFSTVLAIVIYILSVLTLEKTGVPRTYNIALTGFALLVFWFVPTFLNGTTRSFEFLFASQSASSILAAFNIVAACFFPFIFLSLIHI